MNLKDISILSGVGVLLISFIASAGVAKKNIEESKEKITELEKTQMDYKVQQEVIKERTENIQKSIDKLEESIKEGQKLLLEEIKKKKR